VPSQVEQSCSWHPTVSFVKACERVGDNVVWDIVDYHFSVNRASDSCEVAVGIAGDWQDRLSQSELRRLAKAWLLHRLEHGYDPFRERAPSCLRVTQIPFSIVNYWLTHRSLPH
jgi:hypothetical protein